MLDFAHPRRWSTAAPAPTRRVARFADFEVDLRTPELLRNGERIKLQEQPFQVLCMLLEHPGELVTREELRLRLWPGDTFVDFDTGLNTAIKKLRDALGDSADTPAFIETIPRRGYRFIHPLDEPPAGPAAARRRRKLIAIALVTFAMVTALMLSIPAVRDRVLGPYLQGKSLRVAVLPLKNLSGDSAQDYFAAGMTEMLITELGRISALQVTSHQSVLGYAQSRKPLPEIARELNVDAVIEGTVQRAGDRVRVTVNFVAARPENHLLSESFEKDAHQVFEVQEEVARAIAGAIRVRLPEEPVPAGAARRAHPEAIDAWLRGTYLLAKGRDSDRDEARVYFQKAIEMDPEFARPHASLALMYAHGGVIRAGGSPGEALKLSRQSANKAIQLDESLAEPHAALGWLSIYRMDLPMAEREFKRAIELNPSLAVARAWYAQFLGATGRYPEAFVQTEAALQLAPGAPETLSHAVEPYLQGGRVDDAIRQWKRVLELQPDYWGAHHFLAAAYMKKGMHREAVAEAEQTVRANPGDWRSEVLLACAYAKSGDRDKALHMLSEFEEDGKSGAADGIGRQKAAISRTAGAQIYAALGENEKALALLEEESKVGRGRGLLFLNTYPIFDGLRSDPRYQELLRRVGLPLPR